MIIGTFLKTSERGFVGHVPSLATEPVLIRPAPADAGTDWRVIPFRSLDAAGSGSSDRTEYGVAWNRTTRAGKAYISLKLDSPSLPTPINAALFQARDDLYHLVWNRDERKEEPSAS